MQHIARKASVELSVMLVDCFIFFQYHVLVMHAIHGSVVGG